MRVRFMVEATCAGCYLRQRTEITPEFIKRHFFEPLAGALEIAEHRFLSDLVETDGWLDDGERLLCRRCAAKVKKEREGEG